MLLYSLTCFLIFQEKAFLWVEKKELQIDFCHFFGALKQESIKSFHNSLFSYEMEYFY